MVTKRQARKDQSVSAIFLIFSMFSNRNQISLFSRLEKRWGAHARWWAIAIFQLTELNFKANPPCFQYAQKGCAIQMRGIILNSRIVRYQYLTTTTNTSLWKYLLLSSLYVSTAKLKIDAGISNSSFCYEASRLLFVYTRCLGGSQFRATSLREKTEQWPALSKAQLLPQIWSM